MSSDSNPLGWIRRSLQTFTHKGAPKQQDINEAIEKLSDDFKAVTGIESTKDEKEIIRGLLQFSNTTVRQIMKSRLDISAINISISYNELLDQISSLGFSRVPVFKQNLDNIQGVLNVKDLLPYVREGNDFNWQSLLRPCYFIPEGKKIGELLREFQKKRLHLAIVVDEYGGTSGLITMEDILEEIVGEIADEYDEEEPGFVKISEDAYLFEGKTSLNDFCKALYIDPAIFEEVKGESESLSGLLLQINSDLPDQGESIRFEKFEFIVEAVSNKAITKVKVLLNKENEVNNEEN